MAGRHEDLRSDAVRDAMDDVLGAEHEARRSLEDCGQEAERLLSDARREARRIRDNTRRRISRVRAVCARNASERIKALREEAKQERAASHAGPGESALIHKAASRLAKRLTTPDG